jgi:hypothetical protein
MRCEENVNEMTIDCHDNSVSSAQEEALGSWPSSFICGTSLPRRSLWSAGCHCLVAKSFNSNIAEVKNQNPKQVVAIPDEVAPDFVTNYASS